MILRREGLGRPKKRTGASAVELAVVLPFMVFILVVAVDFARIFYYVIAIEGAARAGALYASYDNTHKTDSSGISNAALAEVSNITPQPECSTATGVDADGNGTVSVTVTYTFKTVTKYPLIPNSVALSRTVTMRVLPD